MVDMGIPINKYSFNVLDFKVLFNVSQDGYLVTNSEIDAVHNAWMQADTQLIGAEHFDDDGLKGIAYKLKAKYVNNVNTPYNENSWVENTNPLIEGVQYRPSKYNPNKLDIVNKQDFEGQRRNLDLGERIESNIIPGMYVYVGDITDKMDVGKKIDPNTGAPYDPIQKWPVTPELRFELAKQYMENVERAYLNDPDMQYALSKMIEHRGSYNLILQQRGHTGVMTGVAKVNDNEAMIDTNFSTLGATTQDEFEDKFRSNLKAPFFYNRFIGMFSHEFFHSMGYSHSQDEMKGNKYPKMLWNGIDDIEIGEKNGEHIPLRKDERYPKPQ